MKGGLCNSGIRTTADDMVDLRHNDCEYAGCGGIDHRDRVG